MYWRMECTGTIEGVAAYLRAYRPAMEEDDEACERIRAVLLAALPRFSTNGVAVEVECLKDVVSMSVKGVELTLLTPSPQAAPTTLDDYASQAHDAVGSLRFAQASVSHYRRP